MTPMIKDNDVVTPFPIGLAKIIPCPTDSDTSNQFSAFWLFITLKMEAVHTSETWVCFKKTTWYYIQEGCHLLNDLLKLCNSWELGDPLPLQSSCQAWEALL
jgi:hypothetical protein